MCKSIAKPFLKWVGGKGQLLSTFDEMFPQELIEGKIKTYIEPFVGGGAVLFHVLQKYKIEKAYINDINKELINCYRCIKANVNEVIVQISKLEKEYFESNEKSNYFYNVRDRYNEIHLNGHLDFENCADFIFLNKTCFNGLYRVNKAGLFNVPHGKYKNPLICDQDNLRLCSNLLQKVEISFGSYEQVLDKADGNTFVYFDPPYRPLVEKNSFVSYDKSGFDDNNQKKLAENFKLLNGKGCLLMLSNSDPKNTNNEDNFFDDIYQGFRIERVFAKRMINCQASKRGDITEIVVKNYLPKNVYKFFEEANTTFLSSAKNLIKSGVSERSLCGEFKTHFEKVLPYYFSSYYCDVEYNRNFDGQIKTIINDELEIIKIQCDLIVHSRGEVISQDNILALEMKKSDRSQEEKDNDRKRLIALTKKSYDDTWSFDGKSLPEHVCGYLLGIYYEIDIKHSRILVEFYENGKIEKSRTLNF